MPEPTLVLTGGRADRKERLREGLPESAGSGRRAGAALCVNGFILVLAAWAHRRAGVQLHVGAPVWPRPYELSKNWHR